jgi:hypothetical protein
VEVGRESRDHRHFESPSLLQPASARRHLSLRPERSSVWPGHRTADWNGANTGTLAPQSGTIEATVAPEHQKALRT